MSHSPLAPQDLEPTTAIPHATPHAPPLFIPLTTLLLFILALLPRVVGLDRFLTSDERTNIYMAGSDVIAAFLSGDLRGTYWHFYPGVTMSWLDSLGMGGQYLLDSLTGRPPPFNQFIYGDILNLVVANRLPYALLTALFVPLTFLLARQLLPQRIAFLGALFLAVDPFFLAHSRVAHGDGPVAVFMTISTLAFFIFIQHHRTGHQYPVPCPPTLHPPSPLSPHPSTSPALHPSSLPAFQPSNLSLLILSAVAGGLAALTKAPGQFMAIFIVGLSLCYLTVNLWRATQFASRRPQAVSAAIRFWLFVVTVWGIISLAVFVLLWPAMWVDPVGTLRQMVVETFGKVDEGHLVYFFGQPTLDPGPWFYPYVIPFRLTPVVSLGVGLSVIWLIYSVGASRLVGRRHKGAEAPGRVLPLPSASVPLLLLWFFVISLLLFGTLSPKKQDRYLLPLFPFLDLLAAIGWMGLISLSVHLVAKPNRSIRFLISNLQSLISYLLICVLFLLHLLPTFAYYPYYLTYFNPLLGGPTRAAETTLMGWGEGMEQVAAYLNAKPNAGQLYVASTPSQTLLPYFAGAGENFYTNDIAFRADYVVLYLAQIQRLAPSPEIVNYFLAQEPEKTVVIHGVDYAKIYPGPKQILTSVPPDATPTNIGLENVMRLAGYEINPTSPSVSPSSELPWPASDLQSPISNLHLTLYWHALAPIADNYTISVRLLAADGQQLVQQDQWPVSGLLPTSQWRQGDYVADTHQLQLPADAPAVTQIEIVVYNAATNQALGPPMTISNE